LQESCAGAQSNRLSRVPSAFITSSTRETCAITMSMLNDVSSQNVPPNSSVPEDAVAVAQKLRSQVEFYFSATNLARDGYLVQFLQTTGAVPLGIIANFPKVRGILAVNSLDVAFLVQSLQESSVVALSPDGGWLIPRTPMQIPMVQPPLPMQYQHVPAPNFAPNNDYNKNMQSSTPPKARNTIILREVPSKTTAEDILSTFSTAKSVKADVGNTWFVTFESEEDAVEAVFNSKDYTLYGQPVKARVKSETVQNNVTPPPPPVAANAAPAMYHPGTIPVYHHHVVPAYYTYTQPIYNSAGKNMQQQSHYHHRSQNNNYGHGHNMNGRYRRNGGGRMHHQQHNHHRGHNYHSGSNPKSHHNGAGGSNVKGNNFKTKPASARANRNGNSNNSHNSNTNANMNANSKPNGGISVSTSTTTSISTSTSPATLFDTSNDFPVLHGSNHNRVSATTTGYADALLNKNVIDAVEDKDEDDIVQALKATTLEPVDDKKEDADEQAASVEKPVTEKINAVLQEDENNHQSQKEEEEVLSEVEVPERIQEEEVKPAGAWGSKRLFADVVKQP